MANQAEHMDKKVEAIKFANREQGRRHHYYDEEMKQYKLMQAGDPVAVEESAYMITSEFHGLLSESPVRNIKYLFVANITLATRFAIEGGMDSETAYNISDMYIQRMDLCRTVGEVLATHREMFTYFTNRMATLKKGTPVSQAVLRCIDYIELHLNNKILISDLARYVNFSASYLATLFKREMNMPIYEYILNRKMNSAKNMLLCTEYSFVDISNFLGFSSQSYFIRAFKRLIGMTPLEYRKKYFRRGIDAASNSSEIKQQKKTL